MSYHGTALRNLFFRACFDGDVKLAEKALKQGAWVNDQDSNGWCAIMIASENGHLGCVELLLNKGADPEIENQHGANALMLACLDGHSKCVELLLNKGANVEIQNQDGWNALMLACQNGHSKCVELLLNKGANMDIQNLKGVKALMLACQNGHLRCAELLLKYGADPNAQKPGSGTFALYLASGSGHEACVELLLQYGADVNLQPNNGRTALQCACLYGRLQCVQLLMESGLATTSMINAVDSNGYTAMSYACSHGSSEIVHLLIDAKADMYIGKYCASDVLPLLNHPEAEIDEKQLPGAKKISYPSSYDLQLTGFVLMCGGYDLKRARESIGHLREDYQRTHALLEERQSELLAALDTDVVVDTRLHRKENGLYHEPMEQVLAYCGMLLKPEMLNIHEDDKKKGGRVMLTGSFEALKMAFDWHFARICGVCDATSNASMKKCTCDVVRYCSTACQTKDWRRHKKEYKRIMKDRQQ